MPQTVTETKITSAQAKLVADLLLRAVVLSKGEPVTIRISELDIQVTTRDIQVM